MPSSIGLKVPASALEGRSSHLNVFLLFWLVRGCNRRKLTILCDAVGTLGSALAAACAEPQLPANQQLALKLLCNTFKYGALPNQTAMRKGLLEILYHLYTKKVS